MTHTGGERVPLEDSGVLSGATLQKSEQAAKAAIAKLADGAKVISKGVAAVRHAVRDNYKTISRSPFFQEWKKDSEQRLKTLAQQYNAGNAHVSRPRRTPKSPFWGTLCARVFGATGLL